MASVVMRGVVAGVAVAALVVTLAPIAGAEQPCADPAMCQAPAPPAVHEDAELHSAPNPNDLPQAPHAGVPPWQLINAPGEARYHP
ncbi:hypothetical protein FZI91_09305 [Mycobacterium sp. CBMA271]|uniref:hypothetical protein n=1 Tax=unclassified Mycobacteroides TaxID=2618759 RepID=UPI0012DD29A2|nr:MULTISPECIES: hypothetical protein [unclassified Mycobacteroides]MUM15628.1 hypothetical protein [Mycobacteroides sp. CBMA 326]MUM17423.1 hypothetical protein [Mycobacteroides sp. CBMA 326]MUM21898.1 hypothetical protein [Mycobacteroides sp. CBMA 271]